MRWFTAKGGKDRRLFFDNEVVVIEVVLVNAVLTDEQSDPDGDSALLTGGDGDTSPAAAPALDSSEAHSSPPSTRFTTACMSLLTVGEMQKLDLGVSASV
jgi:hypothetical protein